MQNGYRKMMDSRYDSLYPKKGQKVDPLRGKQLPGAIVKQMPTFMDTAYKGSKKK